MNLVAEKERFNKLYKRDVISYHAQPIHSIEDGIEKALAENGKNARIAVIPNGPYALARLRERLT